MKNGIEHIEAPRRRINVAIFRENTRPLLSARKLAIADPTTQPNCIIPARSSKFSFEGLSNSFLKPSQSRTPPMFEYPTPSAIPKHVGASDDMKIDEDDDDFISSSSSSAALDFNNNVSCALDSNNVSSILSSKI